jgi:hypothetical protein
MVIGGLYDLQRMIELHLQLSLLTNKGPLVFHGSRSLPTITVRAFIS